MFIVWKKFALSREIRRVNDNKPEATDETPVSPLYALPNSTPASLDNSLERKHAWKAVKVPQDSVILLDGAQP